MKYTIIFSKDQETKFNSILGRLDESEYTIVEPITSVKPEDPRSKKQVVIDTDQECCLTFRMGMKDIEVRKERTEEELKKEQEIKDRHTVKVTVYTGNDETTP